METLYDYSRFAVLYVDDEEKSLKYFERAFGKLFRVHTAINAEAGYNLFYQNRGDIALVITDQRMPGESGTQLLERVRKLEPRTIRILATAYSDLDAAIEAVNRGAIYKYVTKPWDVPQLEITLKRGLEFYTVQRERDALMREKLSTLHNMLITDRVISLGIVAAGLGHYVRNALVAVRTFLDLAPSKLEEERINIKDLRNPNYWMDFYAQVQKQVSRITELFHDLGAVSNQSKPLPTEPVDVPEVLARIIEEQKGLLEQKGISVQVGTSADLAAIKVDVRQFTRMFELLIRDELLTLPRGSTIQFSFSNGAVIDGTAVEGMRIQMSDNGPGIPDQALRSVFDPFHVRGEDYQDFGLNLMAVYFIVFHHGGRIAVTNRNEGGTLFQLDLPSQPLKDGKTDDDADFLGKVLVNERLWEKLLAGY